MNHHTLEVETTALGPLGTVLHVAGESHPRALPGLRAELRRAATIGSGPLVVDFTHATFVDSPLVRALLEAHRRLGSRRRLIVVANAQSTRLLFEFAAGGSFELAATFADALVLIRTGSPAPARSLALVSAAGGE